MDIKISIVIPLYNAQTYLERTLTSIKEQTFGDFEVLIVDDCSTDQSLEIAREFAASDDRFTVFTNEENSGKAYVLKNYLGRTEGKYIAFIDADDFWDRTKLEKQFTLMEEHNYLLSYTAYDKVNADFETIKTIHASYSVNYLDMLKYCRVGYSTVMIERSVLDRVSIPDLRKRQDYALWLKLSKNDDFYGLDESLTKYTIHNNSLSRNKVRLVKWNWRVYRYSEGLGLFESLYYLLWDVLSKLLLIK